VCIFSLILLLIQCKIGPAYLGCIQKEILPLISSNSYRQIWLTWLAYNVMPWLADWPSMTAALLWLVVQAYHDPLTLQLKIDLLFCHFRWQLCTVIGGFSPLRDWPVPYSEEYLCTYMIWPKLVYEVFLFGSLSRCKWALQIICLNLADLVNSLNISLLNYGLTGESNEERWKLFVCSVAASCRAGCYKV